MARWDDEQFHSLVPPKDIMCASCKYKAPPVTVGDYTQDRSGYSMCDKYKNKPIGILLDRKPCPQYEKE